MLFIEGILFIFMLFMLKSELRMTLNTHIKLFTGYLAQFFFF